MNIITKYDKKIVSEFMAMYFGGWCDYYEILYDLVIEHGIEDGYIIEVGCFEAGSTLVLAFASEYKELTKPIISIDIRGRINMPIEEYLMKNRIYGQIMTTMIAEHNIALSGIGEKIISIITKSDWAIDFLHSKKACIVLIDGAHGFEPTRNDILNYGNLLLPGGVIICHDYTLIISGCRDAIDQFVRDSLLYSNFVSKKETAWAIKNA